ncbi:MAG: FAD-binding protein [Solirubrobacterales bacterium]|nr:FAD-binding protein [Solirubrobacterales bacterium]
MAAKWSNWAGDASCRPARIERPANRAELVDAVRRAAVEGQAVRAVGAGHSFGDLACTGGVLLRLDRLTRVLDVDRDSHLVKVEAGIGLRVMNETIWSHGLSLENLGDIDRQTVSGAISTGTHGTGSGFRNMSTQVEAVELALPDGSMIEISADSEPEALPAARIALGALGVIATVTLRVVPAFTLRRVDSPRPLGEVLENLDDLADGSDHFEFYVFPHTETALIRQSERTADEPRPRNAVSEFAQEIVLENWAMDAISRIGRAMPSRIPALARFAAGQVGRSEKVDRSYRVFASQRRIHFVEMEYAIPRRHAAEAIRSVLEVAERPELRVGFPIEVRFAAPDDSHLSPAHDRDTAYVAVHMYEGMPFEAYFRAVEEIMDGYGGRPHWGKRHFQTAATLAPRYPRWEEFLALRDRLDPRGAFRNAHLDRVLGPPSALA